MSAYRDRYDDLDDAHECEIRDVTADWLIRNSVFDFQIHEIERRRDEQVAFFDAQIAACKRRVAEIERETNHG